MSGSIQVHVLTHKGAKRPANEDALAVDDWIAANDLHRPKRFDLDTARPHGVLLADGMGGQPGGEVASGEAVAFCAARAHAIVDRDDAARLLDDVNAHIYAEMTSGAGARGMGTTLAGAVLRPEGVLLFNVGDSKIYRWRAAEGLIQVSYDDTPGPRLADGRTAAETSPMLTQALGGNLHESPVTPHVEALPLHAGERFLLCSDGLSDLVAPERLSEILDRSEDDAAAVTAMFEDAMAQGGRDNVSIALIAVL
jgi:serine/threonine protein phosphatase PrpC